jgi:hypothetical protein
MTRPIALALMSILLAGCASTAGYEAVLRTWVGDTTDHLVAVWGVPQQEYGLQGGGKVLQYERSGTIVLPGATTYQAQTTYSNGSVSGYGSNGNSVNGSYNGTSTTYVPEKSDPIVIAQRCVTRFTADASGRINRWSWEGNACRSVAPPKPTAPVPVAVPVYQKCTADQLRQGTCS